MAFSYLGVKYASEKTETFKMKSNDTAEKVSAYS